MRRLLLTMAVGVLAAVGAQAQPAPAPAPAAPDPLIVQPAAQGWVWAQSYWASGTARRDMAGGRFEALTGAGRWGFGVRAETIGLPNIYNKDNPATFQSAQAFLAVHRNVLHVPQGDVTCGVAAFGGAAVPLELQDGKSPTLPSSFTAGVGARCQSAAWWAYTAVGQHQAFRGVALMVTVQARLTDRTAWVGDFVVGPHGKYIANFGIAARVF